VVTWASGAQVSYSHFALFLLQLLIGNWVSFSDFTISSSCATPCVPLPLAWGCNLMMSSEDLFARQRQTWATCRDWVQTMILKNIRETIKAKIVKEHGIQKIAVKSLLTIGKQWRQRCRVRCLDGPPTGNSSHSE